MIRRPYIENNPWFYDFLCSREAAKPIVMADAYGSITYNKTEQLVNVLIDYCYIRRLHF